MTTTTTAKPYDFDEDSNHWISHLKVMKSAAGYYIGRDCYAEDEPLLLMPFDRDSNYFSTAEAAQKELDYLLETDQVDLHYC